MDGLGLSKRGLKKILKKHHLLRLENLLMIEAPGQADIFHTFYKVKGNVIEPEQIEKYKPEEIESETVKLNSKSQKLAETETEFRELLELWLIDNEIEIDDTSLRQTAISKLIDDLNNAKEDYNKVCSDNSFKTDFKLLDVTKRYLEYLKEMKVQKGKRLHPSFDPNLWSSKAYELFKYLFDNYYGNELERKPTKRKLTNIWFYLKELGNDYPSYLTKEVYKTFILEKYEEEITNFDKADKYHDIEMPRINEHRAVFEDALK